MMGKLLALVAPILFTSYSTSNIYGSSVAGVILQDQETLANLEKVKKFNSSVVMQELTMESFRITQNSNVFKNVLFKF